jgi:hypothetical protein
MHSVKYHSIEKIKNYLCMYAQQWIGFSFFTYGGTKTVWKLASDIYVHTVTEAAMQLALKPSSSQLQFVIWSLYFKEQAFEQDDIFGGQT